MATEFRKNYFSMLLKICLSILTVVCLLCPEKVKAAALYRHSEARCWINVPQNPGMVMRFASEELAAYLEKIGGGKVSFTERDGAPITLKVVPNGKVRDSYSIISTDDEVILSGVNERSVLYAVYAFLESLGCRFFAPQFDFYPSGMSEVVPSDPDLDSGTKTLSNTSRIRLRGLRMGQGKKHTEEQMLQVINWMAKNRCNLFSLQTNNVVLHDNPEIWEKLLLPELAKRGIELEEGGHNFDIFMPANKYGVKHPEWFFAAGSGKAKGKISSRNVFDFENVEALTEFTSNLRDYLKNHPGIDYFRLWPQDTEQWSPDKHGRTPSDRYAMLLNQVSKNISKDANSDMQVGYCAYRNAIFPPSDMSMDKSVYVDFCPYARQYQYALNDPSSKVNAFYAETLQSWFEKQNVPIRIFSYYRKYAWHSLPILPLDVMQADMAYYSRLGVDGISHYSEPLDWRTYELTHFIFARLPWSQTVSIDEVLSDFMKHRSPKYWRKMLSVIDELQKIVPLASSMVYADASPLFEAVEENIVQDEFSARNSLSSELKKLSMRLRSIKSKMKKMARGTDNSFEKKYLTDFALMVRYAELDSLRRFYALKIFEVGHPKYLAGLIEVQDKIFKLGENLDGLGLLRRDVFFGDRPENMR